MFKLRISALAIALALNSAAALAQFTDQGFNDPRVSGDFADPTYGSEANPLIIGSCLFYHPDDPSCQNPPRSFQVTNTFKNYPGPFAISPWNLHYNNEPWETQFVGPPGQTLMPSVNLATSTIGFSTQMQSQIGESMTRAHMSINHLVPNNHPLGYGAIPHVSIGEFSSRTGRILGTLNDPNGANRLSFVQRIWDARINETKGSVYFNEIYAFSEWGGKPRAVFLTLQQHNYNYDYDVNINGFVPGVNGQWNWPINGSMFYPGGDLGYFKLFYTPYGVPSCEGVVEGLPIVDTASDHRYTINLQRAFECASDRGLFDTPMPRDQVLPIKTIGWDTEGTREGTLLWASVHDMRLLRASDKIPQAGVFASKADGSYVQNQKAQIDVACARMSNPMNAADRCTKSFSDVSHRAQSSTSLSVLGSPAINTAITVQVQVNTNSPAMRDGYATVSEANNQCKATLNSQGYGTCTLIPSQAGSVIWNVTYSGNNVLFGSESANSIWVTTRKK
jgi:hypothetical protein